MTKSPEASYGLFVSNHYHFILLSLITHCPSHAHLDWMPTGIGVSASRPCLGTTLPFSALMIRLASYTTPLLFFCEGI